MQKHIIVLIFHKYLLSPKNIVRKNKKILTKVFKYVNILSVLAGMAELADAPDLESGV